MSRTLDKTLFLKSGLPRIKAVGMGSRGKGRDFSLRLQVIRLNPSDDLPLDTSIADHGGLSTIIGRRRDRKPLRRNTKHVVSILSLGALYRAQAVTLRKI